MGLPGLDFLSSPFPFGWFRSSLSIARMLQPGGNGPPNPGGTEGGLLKVLAGGSFAKNGMPFAFCDAGVLPELPWANTKVGAAIANAAITTKDFNIFPVPLPTSYVGPIFRAFCCAIGNAPGHLPVVNLECCCTMTI